MKRILVAAIALVLAIGLISGLALAGKGKGGKDSKPKGSDSEVLRTAVKNKGLFTHLKAFQKIANENGGNRASNTPGYTASADYVEQKLTKYGWKVKRVPFEYIAYAQNAPSVFEQTAPTPTTYEENTEFSTMEYSGSGDVTAELVAVDLTLPPAPEPSSTSGCEASDFTGPAAVTGKIALMQRGTCDFGVKVANAEAAGAIGSVIFNEGQPGRTDVVFGTLGAPVGIPAVDTDFALGEELAAGTLNGPTGTSVHIKTDTTSTPGTTENVIAETKKGSGKNVVMAGAHLDSVSEGPGINDNGSGSAALIEIAKQISKQGIKPENKLRFAWWGAEEAGLFGSTDYVANLTEAQYLKIALYLNFDMIGSPNYARLIYDGNASAFEAEPPPGSGAIERTFARYFSSQDLDSGQTAFDGRSDYGPFIDVGIPSGGLFTGAEEVKTDAQQAAYGGTAGEAFDACYHQACDDLDNVNKKGMHEMSDAVAHSIAIYADKLKFIPRPEVDTKRELRQAQRGGGSGTEYLGDSLKR
jgi:Zn-dependent M28 family amino/carboxypeptidase